MIKREKEDNQQVMSLSKGVVPWGCLIQARSVFVHQAGVCDLESCCPWIWFACTKFDWTSAVPLLTAGYWTLGNTKKEKCTHCKRDALKNVKIKRASIVNQLHLAKYPTSGCRQEAAVKGKVQKIRKQHDVLPKYSIIRLILPNPTAINL